MANEKRLIDANWILGQIEHDIGCYELENVIIEDGLYVELRDVVRMVCAAPTLDAVEVVHGWWIELPGMEPDYKCSECGQSYAWWEPSEAHYCPNCGAKMDGDGNG